MSELTELPDGWTYSTIGEITLPFVTVNPKSCPDKKFIYVDIGSIDNTSQTIKSPKTFLGIDAPSRARRLVQKGDILFSTVRTYLKNIARVPNELDGVLTSTGIAVLRAAQGINGNYLFYVVSSDEFIRSISSAMDGTLYPAVTDKDVSTATIPLPPLNEQRRIVSTIEQLTDRSHKARAALEDVPKLIAQFRQSVLAAAFRGDLTADWREKNPDVEPASELLERIKIDGLPQKWCEINIGQIIEGLKYGTSQKCGYENNGIPVLRIPNIGEGKIKLSDLKYAKLPEKELESLKLRTGDILLIRSNGSVSLVGKTALVSEVEEGYAYAGYLIRLRVNQKLVNPKYLNLCFSSHSIRLQIELPARSTSGVNNINSTEVQKLMISLPPLAEQVEIISRLEKCFKSIQIIEEQYNNSHEQLETLDRSILAKAFRGELVPQDPNDEPAAVLLERIRAERACTERSRSEQTSTPKQRGKTTRKNSSKQLVIDGIE